MKRLTIAARKGSDDVKCLHGVAVHYQALNVQKAG